MSEYEDGDRILPQKLKHTKNIGPNTSLKSYVTPISRASTKPDSFFTTSSTLSFFRKYGYSSSEQPRDSCESYLRLSTTNSGSHSYLQRFNDILTGNKINSIPRVTQLWEHDYQFIDNQGWKP